MPLTNPAITELTVEKATLNLIAEFLGQFFDGNTHVVGANTTTVFPKATLKFQQSHQPQEGAVLGITTVWNAPSDKVLRWEVVSGARQQMAYAKTLLNFWVRCELMANAKGNAREQCRDAAQLLSALMGNSGATRTLHGKGIHRIRSGTPQAVADAGYSLRLVPVRVTLRWPVLSQVAPTSGRLDVN
jgi:hypothetical protein